MYDVLCVSDCCCDLIFQGLARIPAPGTEEYAKALYLKAGGGANTPMGLAKLGCRTAYLTAVGDDDLGALVLNDLREAGVSPDYLRRAPGTRTWVSAVLSTPGDRAFASFAGAGVAFTEAEAEKLVKRVRWVHTYSCYCETFPFLVGVCKKAGVPLSMDAAFDAHVRSDGIAGLLAEAELFTPNDREACILTGETDPRAALERLAEVCRNVVVTMGEAGCMAALDGLRFWVFPPAVSMADANGAGDLFNAGLIAARLAGRPPEEQLRFAAASGALAVTYPGGMDPRYTKDRVRELAERVRVEELV